MRDMLANPIGAIGVVTNSLFYISRIKTVAMPSFLMVVAWPTKRRDGCAVFLPES